MVSRSVVFLWSCCGLLRSHPSAQNAEEWGPLLLSGLEVHLECVGHLLLVLVAKGLLALRWGHLVPQHSQVLLEAGIFGVLTQ